MCGIGFIRRMKDRPIEPWQVKTLACSLEHRGNDATGLAVQFDDGRIEVLKNHEPAWRFLGDDRTQKWLDKQLGETARTVLVHTRRMTKGSQYRNENNHPMYSGKCAVVHNGMVGNDDALFSQLGLKRGAETDSDIIRAIVDKHGLNRGLIGRDGKLNKLNGTVAACVIHPEAPGDILLLRSNNPLYLGSNGEHLCGASTKRSCFLALKRYVNRHGIPMAINDEKLAFISMPNNTGWLMNDKLKWHELFSSSSFQRNVTYDVHKPDWLARNRRALAEAEKPPALNIVGAGAESPREPVSRPTHLPDGKIDFVICPGVVDASGTTCGVVVDIRAKMTMGKTLIDLQCPKCKANLRQAAPCTDKGELVN